MTALATLLAACGGGELGLPPYTDAEKVVYGGAQGATAGGPKSMDPATFGTIAGKVRYEGPPKRNRRLSLADEFCVGSHPDGLFEERFQVGEDGALKDAVVYIQSMGRARFDPPQQPVVLDQQGCQYVPHVATVQVGQPLEVRNSDPILHNVHGIPVRNREFNIAQGRGAVDTVVFARPEIGIRVACDIHGWMVSYVCVTDHPFAAVTGDDGGFTLEGVPPGEYVLVVWHEEFDAVEQGVSLDFKEGKTVEIVLK